MEGEVAKLVAALPDTENAGACICDFETFKEAYRVQRGVQARYGLPVFLAIMTVAPGQDAEPDETSHDGGSAGRAHPHEPAPVRCGRPLYRDAVCHHAVRQCRRDRVQPAGTHQGRRSTACPPMAVTCSATACTCPKSSPTAAVPAASAAKNSKIFPPSRKKVSRLGGFFLIFYTFHNLLPKIFYKKSKKTV